MSETEELQIKTPAGQWTKIIAAAIGSALISFSGMMTLAAKPWTKEDVIIALCWSLGSGALTLGTGLVMRPKDAWDGVADRRAGRDRGGA